ncbi:hypothetical protein QWM81_07485 [Streptomyces ficellus]|uniref:DUF3592 domain-containing protein n=1 Tax=Streptomyces ficellus TaxID=1977088 RepID=A0ABT7Z325_9ACTN|nr:hypothetical protein [Streptomyces ficellus]MDN3293887.1 hypothetical protein [Streptomyces ficellus]
MGHSSRSKSPYGPYFERRRSEPTTWTRLTGLVTLLAAFAAMIVGVLPLAPDVDVRNLRLGLVGCTAVGAVLWTVASIRSRRPEVTILDKPARKERDPSRFLPVVLSLALPLASAAALAQAIGLDGAEGRWEAQVYAAGGGSYEVTVDALLDEPGTTGVNINDVDQYATDVAVTLRFHDGTRTVTVHDATTVGRPEVDDTVRVMYAPGSPGLGVRNDGTRFFSSGLLYLWLWALALFAWAFGSAAFGMMRDGIHTARRFRADVHVPAALILLTGVCLLLPGAFFHTSTWAGWLLALAAATTPWLALAWMLKRG